MEYPSLSQRLKSARSVVNLRKGRTDWYRIENVKRATADQPSTADIYIYDEIGYFGVTASDFVRDLQAVDVNEISLHLNSPGGDVFEGIAIYNALKNHKATVATFIDGLAASAASFIAMAGDTVVIERNAQMMIHDAHGLCIGNANDMSSMVDLLDKNSDNIADIYAQKAGGTVKDWRAAMRAETWYSADEALQAGLADEVSGGNKKDSVEDNSWDLSVFAFAGREKAPAPRIAAHASPPAIDIDFAEVFRQAMEEAAK